MSKIITKNSKIHGRGIFASKKINKGEIVCVIKGSNIFKINKNKRDAISHPNWVGIGMNNWVDPTPPYKYLNHSCDPNTAIKGHRTLIAIKEINKDDEITIDYSITEVDTRWKMECKCGAISCRNIIRSIQYLPKKIFDNYNPYISKDFVRVYMDK